MNITHKKVSNKYCFKRKYGEVNVMSLHKIFSILDHKRLEFSEQSGMDNLM